MILFVLITSVSSLLTNQPVWVTSDFFRAGNQFVISSLTGSSVTPTHTFTFSSALSGIPLLGYGIKIYEGSDYFGQQRFEVNRTALTSSTFTVAVQIVGVTNIWNLNVAYIAIDPLFPHQMNSFDNIPINVGAGALTNITSKVSTYQSYSNTINFTLQSNGLSFNKFSQPLQGNKILLFMTSLYIQATLQASHLNQALYLPLDIFIDCRVVSVDQYQITATMGIEAFIEKLHFSQIIFNQKDVQSSLKYVLIYDRVDIDPLGQFIPIPPEFVDNFIMGLTDFSTQLHTSILDFRWQFATINGVHGVLVDVFQAKATNIAMGNKTLNRTGYTIFYIKTWFCPPQTSFFDQSTQLCTQCPISNCNTCLSLIQCHECDWYNQYYVNPLTKQCIQCKIGFGECYDQETYQCFLCDNYTNASLGSNGNPNTIIFLIEVDGNLTLEEIQSSSRFTNDKITEFVVIPTEIEGVYRIEAKYEGNLEESFTTHFILPNGQTFHVLYEPLSSSRPNLIVDDQLEIIIPEPEDLSIFIAIGTALAILGCCCILCICGLRRYKNEKKKKKAKKNKKKSEKRNNKIMNNYSQQITQQDVFKAQRIESAREEQKTQKTKKKRNKKQRKNKKKRKSKSKGKKEKNNQ